MAIKLFQRAVVPFERRRGQSRWKHFFMGCLNGGLVSAAVVGALMIVSPLPDRGDALIADEGTLELAKANQEQVKPKVPLVGLAESSGRAIELMQEEITQILARRLEGKNQATTLAQAEAETGLSAELAALEVTTLAPADVPTEAALEKAQTRETVETKPQPSVVLTAKSDDSALTRSAEIERPDPASGEVEIARTAALDTPRAPESYRPAGVTAPKLALDEPIRIQVPATVIAASGADSAALDVPATSPDLPEASAPVEAASLTLDETVVQVRASSTEEPFNDLPLLAIVLDNAGESSLSAEILMGVDLPLSLGVAPGAVRATEIAAIATLTGHEVVAQMSLGRKEGENGLSIALGPEDQASQMLSGLADLPSAVAVATLDQTATAQNSQTMRALMSALQAEGLGYVERRNGPKGTAARLADDLGTPYAAVTRDIPPEASADFIYRALSSAAREARLSGAVIISGPANVTMLEALVRWEAERGRRAAQIVALSQILAR